MAVPYTFGSATSAIPLSQLDSNFATTITLGNTAIQLGNTVTTLNNMTLANVTISSGNVTITNVSVTTANVTTLNAATVIATTGNITTVNATTVVATTANATTANITTGNLTDLNLTNNPTFSGGTANGVLYLNGSKVATSGSALTFDGTNLGVGTASPPSKLGVYAATGGSTTGLTVNASGNMLNLFGSSSTNAGVIFDATDGTVGSATGVPMIWRLGGSEQARLTSTGLGVGTSSPAAKLDVYSSSLRYVRSYPSSGLADFEVVTNNNSQPVFAVKGTGTADLIRAYSGSTQVLTLDSSGNLGLGVTPSGWDTALKAIQVNTQGVFASETNAVHVMTNVYYNSGYKYIGTGYATDYYQYLGAHVWRTASSGSAGGTISWTQAMTLTAAGKLGIGNTNPGEVLDVTGNITLGSGTSGSITINGAGGTGACTLNILGGGSGNPSWDIGTYSSPSAFTFGYTTGGTRTERARIDSSGNLLVGTTSSSLMGGESLKIQGGTDTTSGQYSFLAYHSNAAYYFGLNNNGYVQSSAVYGRTTASAANVNVDASGYITRSTSARKYKHDIRDIEEIDISLLRPVRYKSKCESDDQTKDHLGVIADEAADAGFEELVTRGVDGEVEGFQYERLTVVLLKELQSLRKRVAQLEGK